MLDMMAGNENSVIVYIAKEQFERADILILTEKCDPYIGGGYYLCSYSGTGFREKKKA